MNDTFIKIKEAFLESETILISGHKNPDGDSIGSSLALGRTLSKLGKKVTIYMRDLPPEYKMLRGQDMLSNKIDMVYDLCVVLDCADADRLEIKKHFEAAKKTINIDHHINNPNFADINYVDDTASSTAEIMQDMLNEMEFEKDKHIAEALYTGIISDTGLFQNRNTEAKTFLAVSELMEYKIDFNKIISNLFFKKTFTEVKLLGKAISKAERYADDKIIISTLTREEIFAEGAKPNETSNIINTLRQVDGALIAVFIYEPIPNNVKVSFRCDHPYNVYEIANMLGGGGHILASGAIIKGTPIEEVKSKVIELCKEQIDIYNFE